MSSSTQSSSPTEAPSAPSSSNITRIMVIIGISTFTLFLVLVSILVLKRNSKKKKEAIQKRQCTNDSNMFNDRAEYPTAINEHDQCGLQAGFERATHRDIVDDNNGFAYNNIPVVNQRVEEFMSIPSHNNSLVSNKSLLSEGYSICSESRDEDNETCNLEDEFDQYKDQKLEKMRSDIEGTVTNFDGMMSQALTKALMDDDNELRDYSELMRGGIGNSMEIEASVLCKMNDWLKRRERAPLEDRRAFIQETLNRMVASVRHGIIAPEDASRTIHESAAMLGLQLAENIPETAVIVTGMRKLVTRKDVLEAFREFGEIDDAAVSPNARGFGLVRYKSTKSVQRAMERFRIGEIVVQDVAVVIKVLKSDARLATINVYPPRLPPALPPTRPKSRDYDLRPPGDSSGQLDRTRSHNIRRGPGSDTGSARS